MQIQCRFRGPCAPFDRGEADTVYAKRHFTLFSQGAIQSQHIQNGATLSVACNESAFVEARHSSGLPRPPKGSTYIMYSCAPLGEIEMLTCGWQDGREDKGVRTANLRVDPCTRQLNIGIA